MKSFYYKQPFADEMVRATIEGRKTLMVLPMRGKCISDFHAAASLGEVSDFISEGFLGDNDLSYLKDYFKFKEGDRYWIKEAFGSKVRIVGGTPHESICYRSDNPKEFMCYDSNGMEYPVKWSPSLHMPQWASRCTIEVKRVYVKRINDATEAESMRFLGYPNRVSIQFRNAGTCIPAWEMGFRDNIHDTYGREVLSRNDWCWFVEFEVVK